jgi:diguanylate cyclase (GGDEF)-like protein
LLLEQSQGVEELCQQALELAAPRGLDAADDLPGAGAALHTLGRLYMARYDFAAALEAFQKAAGLFERAGCPRDAVCARSFLGVVFLKMADYSRAAEVLRQSLREAEALPDDLLAAGILNDLSHTYVLARQPELALQNQQRCIAVFRAAGEDVSLAWALDTLAQAYMQVGQAPRALECIQEASLLARRKQLWIDVSRFLQTAGEIYNALGDLSAALHTFEEELAVARKHNLSGDICCALFSIAEIYLTDGQGALETYAGATEALPMLLEACAIAGQTGIKPHLRQCFLLLSWAYKRLGGYAMALEYHERFYEVDREIFNAEADHRLRSLHALYQLEAAQKEAELYQLRAQALQAEVEERRRAERILTRAASTDPLTELLNRRVFFDLAEKAFAEALRCAQPLALLLIDLDHFKAVNDQFGHQVGDQALALAAQRLRANLRADDIIARYGGEEFIALLPNIWRAEALQLADRLRASVAMEPVRARNVQVPVTMSLGVACLDPSDPPESLDQLIAQADQALYAAKRQGRNVTLAFS